MTEEPVALCIRLGVGWEGVTATFWVSLMGRIEAGVSFHRGGKLGGGAGLGPALERAGRHQSRDGG